MNKKEKLNINSNNKLSNKQQTTIITDDRLYKNKYVICLYDDDDMLVGEFDNPKQLAVYLNKNLQIVKEIVSHKMKKICNKVDTGKIVVDNRCMSIDIIDITSEEQL